MFICSFHCIPCGISDHTTLTLANFFPSTSSWHRLARCFAPIYLRFVYTALLIIIRLTFLITQLCSVLLCAMSRDDRQAISCPFWVVLPDYRLLGEGRIMAANRVVPKERDRGWFSCATDKLKSLTR